MLPFQDRTEDRSTRSSKRPTIELALFFDAAGYQLFMPYFNGDNAKLRDMLLAYMNGVWCVEDIKKHVFARTIVCPVFTRMYLLSHYQYEMKVITFIGARNFSDGMISFGKDCAFDAKLKWY
jgi:hypothetical protein